MDPVPAVALLIAFCPSLIVGIRLLRLAYDTRELPEACTGACSLLVSAGGAAIYVASRSATAMGRGPAWSVETVGLLAVSLGTCALYLGVWCIFRPGDKRAGAVCLVGSAVMLASWLGTILPGRVFSILDTQLPHLLSLIARMTAFAWMGYEATRYHRNLRRRRQHGLSDPLVVHHFLLWGVAAWAISALHAALILFGLLELDRGLVHGPLVAMACLVALVSSTSLWLAFFPPATYARWITASAPLAPRSRSYE